MMLVCVQIRPALAKRPSLVLQSAAMNARRPSVFRDALQVSPERIAALGDTDLKVLMGDLLEAQAYECGSPVSELRVNTQEKAGDDSGKSMGSTKCHWGWCSRQRTAG